MLLRFGQRAPTYDRENRFFQEDFDELRAAGAAAIFPPGTVIAEAAQDLLRVLDERLSRL
jgi:hypothetical protein